MTVPMIDNLEMPLMTALPGSPRDGQVIRYLADATNGIEWMLAYRSASASAYKWEFIGGAALFAQVQTAESSAATSYADLTTVGPTVTPPLAGDYVLAYEAAAYSSGIDRALYLNVAVGAAAPLGADYQVISTENIASRTTYIRRELLKLGLAAATAVKLQYQTNADTATFFNRAIKLTPRRVG
jgi:hypothetical protein